MISSAEDLKSRTGWDGKAGKSRNHVLVSIEGMIKLPSLLTTRYHITNSDGTSSSACHFAPTS
jgi:hypothetical protein